MYVDAKFAYYNLTSTHLMLIKYWASATASGFPLIVIVRSVLPPSRSSQFEIRIMAPEIWRISAILVPPLPIMQPIKSFGTVISCCCVLVCVRLVVVRNCEPARAARAVRVTLKWSGKEKKKNWVSKMLRHKLMKRGFRAAHTVSDSCLVQSTGVRRDGAG